MSEENLNEGDTGFDAIGRKAKPKRPRVKFTLSDRLEGESIEDWIKRDTERLVLESADCKEKRASIMRKDQARAEAGTQYALELGEKSRIKAKRDRAIRALKAEWQKEIEAQQRVVVVAQIKRNKLSSEHKTMLGKYNTLYNRYFNAVKVRVMQNMKSLCNIRHTWADKTTRRTLNTGEGRKRMPGNKPAVSSIKEQVKKHATKAGEI